MVDQGCGKFCVCYFGCLCVQLFGFFDQCVYLVDLLFFVIGFGDVFDYFCLVGIGDGNGLYWCVFWGKFVDG